MATGVHYMHPDKTPELWVNEVGVAPSQQGRGIGKALMAALLEHAKTLGCKEAWVLTEEDNQAARRLYARAGGHEEANRPVYITFPLED
jgi:aminoglycoside 6'-N-acetyltransferase I